MGLRSGVASLVAVGSCSGGAVLEVPLDGGGGEVVTCPLGGGGGGGSHTVGSVLGGPGWLPLHSSLVLGFQWVSPMGRSGFVLSACMPVMLVGSRAPV
jgi:hypothetical protein